MAKKNNPQDEKIEEMLHKVLGRYQEILFKAANAKKGEDVYGYEQRFFRTMETGSNALKMAAKSVVDKYIPNVDTPVSTLLQSFGARYGGEEIKLTTYVRMVDMLTGSVEQYRLRIDEQIRERERQGKVTTVMDLQDIINQDLRDDKVTVVRYANGTSVPVDKYAAMLARTTRAETENLSMIQQALREGIDLVECDIVSPTCDSCAVYQGRVYSISGNDSRYPALYKTAFKSGYSIIHPNCRHSWSPYHVELYSEEEKRQALERSNRTWKPDGDGRVFQQTERARAEYSQGQQLMRQWNAEIVEYERMKDHYKKIGQEPPYKTLGGFRKEVRKPREEQSPIMKAWKRHYADELQYERWKEVIGTQNMPKTLAKFQQIKYNKNTKERYARLEKTFQGYSEYKRDNPDATPSDYQAVCRLKKQGVEGNIHIPPRIVDLTEYGYSSGHINNEHQRGISREESENFIARAIVSIEQGKKGRRQVFYSTEGAAVIDTVEKRIVTSWKRNEYDQKAKTIIKEVIGSGKE